MDFLDTKILFYWAFYDEIVLEILGSLMKFESISYGHCLSEKSPRSIDVKGGQRLKMHMHF